MAGYAGPGTGPAGLPENDPQSIHSPRKQAWQPRFAAVASAAGSHHAEWQYEKRTAGRGAEGWPGSGAGPDPPSSARGAPFILSSGSRRRWLPRIPVEHPDIRDSPG